jgi:hypothetical protein
MDQTSPPHSWFRQRTHCPGDLHDAPSGSPRFDHVVGHSTRERTVFDTDRFDTFDLDYQPPRLEPVTSEVL